MREKQRCKQSSFLLDCVYVYVRDNVLNAGHYRGNMLRQRHIFPLSKIRRPEAAYFSIMTAFYTLSCLLLAKMKK